MSPAAVKLEPSEESLAELVIDALTEADQLMSSMRESGAGWPYIHEAWEKKSGKPIGRSSLRDRYAALQVDSAPLSDEDVSIRTHVSYIS